MEDKKTLTVKLVRSIAGTRVASRHGARPGPAQAQQRIDAGRHAGCAAWSTRSLYREGAVMELNTIKPAEGKKARRRVGRGIGSAWAKTAGRGHKGPEVAFGRLSRSASKAARCRCSAACPSAASSRSAGEVQRRDHADRAREARRGRGRPAGAQGGRPGKEPAGADRQGHQARRTDQAVALKGIVATAGAKAAIEAAGGSVA